MKLCLISGESILKDKFLIEDKIALRDVPFTINENEHGRKCTSCGSENTRRVTGNEPAKRYTAKNLQAYIPTVEVENETVVGKTGDIRFRMYMCKKCGHVDFYSHLVKRTLSQAEAHFG